MTNLIIQATDFGVEPSKAQAIEAVFVPMVQMLKSFETQFDSILEEYKKEVTEELVKKAKRLRLDIARVRIDTDKERKREKEFYLLGGRAVDGIANILKNAVVEKESVLSEIENHFENIKIKQLEAIREERINLLTPYDVDNIEQMQIGIMPQDVFDNFLAGVKKNYEDKKQAEIEAEIERIRIEEEKRKEEERIRSENAKLKAEAEERDKLEKIRLQKEAEERAKVEAEREKERDKLEKIRLQKEAEERAKVEAEREKEREEARQKQAEIEAKAKAEQEAREKLEKEAKERLEADLRKKIEEENRVKQAEAEKEKAEKNAKYLQFLKDNNFDNSKMEVRQIGTTFEIWEKKASITL